MLSITVFGGLFGLVGIVLGVPSFAVLYGLVRRWVNRSLKKRKMDLALETYMEDGRIYENDPEEDLDHGYTEPVKVDPATRAAEQAARKRKRKASTWLAKKMRSRKEKKGAYRSRRTTTRMILDFKDKNALRENRRAFFDRQEVSRKKRDTPA